MSGDPQPMTRAEVLARILDAEASDLASLRRSQAERRRHAGGAVFAALTPAELHRAIAAPRSVAERTHAFLFNG